MFFAGDAVDPGNPLIDKRSLGVAGTLAGSVMQNEFKGSAQKRWLKKATNGSRYS